MGYKKYESSQPVMKLEKCGAVYDMGGMYLAMLVGYTVDILLQQLH